MHYRNNNSIARTMVVLYKSYIYLKILYIFKNYIIMIYKYSYIIYTLVKPPFMTTVIDQKIHEIDTREYKSTLHLYGYQFFLF